MNRMDKLHEECGVFGIFRRSGEGVVAEAYHALYALQHRGQESCGIAVNHDGVISCHKDVGLVTDVFTHDVLAKMQEGSMAVGHCRYGTTGTLNRENAQPMLINHCKGAMAVCHNGNLTNAFDLRDELEQKGAIFHTTSDTEVIAYIITQQRLQCASIEEAVLSSMKLLKGAYSLVIMSPTKLIAARDPHGFRPLCYGITADGIHVVASESCALAAVGAKFQRDLLPGEILTFDEAGVHADRTHCGTAERRACIFEYIYFARPDSVIDGVSVHAARKNAGRLLAKRHSVDADLVVGVPDSGLDAAIGYAEESGIPFGLGFIKNKYIGRTFISPGQGQRVDQVKIKLSPIRDEVEGKRIVLIDDSIVRGTTSGQIVGLLREAGAREIHMRISSPPFRNPCYYGTDIDSRDHLIACHHTVEEIASIIGADSLGYLALEDLTEMIGSADYCHACFSGQYPTAIPISTAKDRFEGKLSQREGKHK